MSSVQSGHDTPKRRHCLKLNNLLLARRTLSGLLKTLQYGILLKGSLEPQLITILVGLRRCTRFCLM